MSPEVLPGAPGSLKRRMAEREDVTDHIRPGAEPVEIVAQAAEIAPDSLRRRMAEREAERMSVLRETLAKQLTPDEWKAPDPPRALRLLPTGVSEPDLLETWQKLQSARQGASQTVRGDAPSPRTSAAREAPRAQNKEAVIEVNAPPGSAKAHIELFLRGEIGLWEAIFGLRNWVEVLPSGVEVERGAQAYNKGAVLYRPTPFGGFDAPPAPPELIHTKPAGPPQGPRLRQRTRTAPSVSPGPGR